MLQKIIVFTMNQMVIAYSSPEVIGQISIQSELLLSTLLFLSREGIRIACLKFNLQSSTSNRQLLINLSWLPCLLVIVLTILLTFARYASRSFFSRPVDSLDAPPTNSSFSDDLIFFSYCLAAFIECLGEPFYNYYQNQLYIQGRLKAETSALFLKSVITFLFVAVFQFSKVSFGFAQIFYSTVYVFILMSHVPSFQQHLVSLQSMYATSQSSQLSSSVAASSGMNKITVQSFLPRGVKDEYDEAYFFDFQLCKSAMMIMVSSVCKHFLTEIDKIILSFYCSNYEQGIYALTNNYGSLIARLLFLPLEDSMRMSFAKLASNLRDEIRHNYSIREGKDLRAGGGTSITVDGKTSAKNTPDKTVLAAKKKIPQGFSSGNNLEAQILQHTLTSGQANETNASSPFPPASLPTESESTEKAPSSGSSSPEKPHYSNDVASKQMTAIKQEKLKLSSMQTDIKSYISYDDMRTLFLQMIRSILFLGCIFALFGPYYIEMLMKYLLKSQWQITEVYQTLQYYCYYLFFLGINGITEAMLQSVIDQDASYFSMNLGLGLSFVCFFITFLSVTVYGSFGTSGIVVANCVGMLVRILWNCYLIYDIFENPIKEFLEFRGYQIEELIPNYNRSSSISKSESDRIVAPASPARAVDESSGKNPIFLIVPSVSWVLLMVIVKASLFANYFYFQNHTQKSGRDMLVYFLVGCAIGVFMLAASFLLLTGDARQQILRTIFGRFLPGGSKGKVEVPSSQSSHQAATEFNNNNSGSNIPATNKESHLPPSDKNKKE